jgi:hypothetical protein
MFSDSSASPGVEAARFATLPGRLHTSDSSGHSATAHQTHASVEYLRTHAGLGQDSRPAKQYRMQLHVTTNAQACGAQVASEASTQPQYQQIKLALDVHAASMVVGRMIDGAKPPPPQTFKPADALELAIRLDRQVAGKDRALAVVRVPTEAAERNRAHKRQRQDMREQPLSFATPCPGRRRALPAAEFVCGTSPSC